MSSIVGIARFRFHVGMVEEFKRLSAECMRVVRELDTGTLRYEIFLNDDESEAIVIEEYVDERALIEHSAHIGEELSAAIIATGTVYGELLGDMSDGFRAQLAGGPVQPFAVFLSKDSAGGQPRRENSVRVSRARRASSRVAGDSTPVCI